MPCSTRRSRIPGQPLRASVWVKGDGQGQWVTISLRDAANKVLDLRPGYATATGWVKFSVNLPASGVAYPVRVDNVRLIETAAARQYKGSFILDDLEVEVPSEIASPAPEPPLADRLISADGTLENADWTFAALSDVQFTAAAPELAKVGIAALKRIRTQHPDFVVLNGDIVDTGFPADIALAKQTLEAGGCDLVESGAPPAPSGDTVPCLYVPGNHESYGTDNLDAWKAVFGSPYRTFDHKGVRFVLLNSTRGTLRGSDWAQLPMLQDALDEAKADPAVQQVMVFAHHPTNDPDPGDASQLGDRKEVALIETLLSGFAADSGKGAAMVGSHAQIVNVDRVEGVPYMVLPSSGKSPYGTPDSGGFTGWVRYGVRPSARDSWLRADVRAFAQSARIDAPEALAAGSSATLTGELVQPNGIATGTRKVPLRYPMSIRWSGSPELALGGSIDDARRAGKVALLDPKTRQLTALRAGSVTVAVESDSMRDGDDLSPVRAEKTILVAPFVAPAVSRASSAGPSRRRSRSRSARRRPSAPSPRASSAPTTPRPPRRWSRPRATRRCRSPTRARRRPAGSSTARSRSPPRSRDSASSRPGPLRSATTIVAVGFHQKIAATDPLRTGAYSKTLTYTLSTTAP